MLFLNLSIIHLKVTGGKFRKEERLKSAKKIQSLFVSGKSLFKFPVKLAYRIENPEEGGRTEIKAAFSVPKKRIKKAVDRNKVKRRMREAYRLNKMVLWDDVEGEVINISLMWIYVSEEILDYSVVEKAIKDLIRQLQVKELSTKAKLE